MSDTAEISHGRGGAGNFAADDTKYVDGEVVRTGVEGSHNDGAFSSGRGGKNHAISVNFHFISFSNSKIPDRSLK